MFKYQKCDELFKKYYHKKLDKPYKKYYFYLKFFKSETDLTNENIEFVCHLKNNVRNLLPQHIEYVKIIYDLTKNKRYLPCLNQNEIIDFINQNFKYHLTPEKKFFLFKNVYPTNNLYTYDNFYIIICRSLIQRDNIIKKTTQAIFKMDTNELNDLKNQIDFKNEKIDKITESVQKYIEQNNVKTIESIQKIQDITNKNLTEQVKNTLQVTENVKILIDQNNGLQNQLKFLIQKYDFQNSTTTKIFLLLLALIIGILLNIKNINQYNYEIFLNKQCEQNPNINICL